MSRSSNRPGLGPGFLSGLPPRRPLRSLRLFPVPDEGPGGATFEDGDALLLETANFILLENGDKLLLE